MKTVILIQSRMGSSRLPGKALLPFGKVPALQLLLERLSAVKGADIIAVATSTNPVDDKIAQLCESLKQPIYRGSESDVLGRMYLAAKHFEAATVLRITGDCPFMDPQLVDSLITYFSEKQQSLDYASNVLTRRYPRGMDCEIFSFEALAKAFKEASENHFREHVTPYIYGNPSKFRLGELIAPEDNSQIRLTLDTAEDYQFLTELFALIRSAGRGNSFNLQDILHEIKNHQELLDINSRIEQKTVEGPSL